MDITEELFVNLLGNYINKIPVKNEYFVTADGKRLIELTKMHGVAGIIYTGIKGRMTDVEEIMSAGCMSEIARYSRRILVKTTIEEILEGEKISYVCIKGCQLYEFYPDPEFRTMSDIDMLIEPKNMDRMRQALEHKGVTFVPEHSQDNVWTFRTRGVEIELHQNLVSEGRLMNGYDYDGYFKDAWNHVVQSRERQYCYYLENEYNLCYLMFHIAKHFYNNGCGVRMLMDIPIFVSSCQYFDWDLFWKEAQKISLDKFSERIFTLCEKWFGNFGVQYRENIRLKKDSLTDVEKFIVSYGTFGYNGRNTVADKIKIKADGGNYRQGLIKWAFPDCKTMREYSPWFREKPTVFLPMAYIERIVRNTRERGGFFKVSRDVLTGNKELNRKKKLLETMGIE